MYEGGEGVTQDYKEAVKWYRKAAEQGHANVQLYLGTMYENGEGVDQDFKEAVKWYRKAAEQGHAEAQLYLGTMYEDGNGVTKDYVQAHKWFNTAAANGDKEGAKKRDVVETRMTSADITKAQKLAREWMKKHQK